MIPLALQVCSSPLRWQDWETALARHPDRRFADFIVNGIRSGFCIGFNYSRHCTRARGNMPTTLEHPEVVREYIRKELAEGRLLGPFYPSDFPDVQVSRLGVVPKKGQNKWRLILDLSSPEGRSVNDGISPDLCSILYVSVDDAARAVVRVGQGALLAKVDVKSAYRIVEVHPDDRLLLGFQFDGHLFVDAVLPFGLRSAPKLFTALADALEWVTRHSGVESVIHYLDDFLLAGALGSHQCATDLSRLLRIFDDLHVPVAPDKLEDPSTVFTFLGIELDTQQMVLRLPQLKLVELRTLLSEWRLKRFCVTKELQSLVGKLQHACKVIRPGRTFLRRMFELLKGTPRHRHFIRLNTAFWSDLAWWFFFLEVWNGVSMLAVPQAVDNHLFSDASGGLGCGTWANTSWFQYLWPEGFTAPSIAVMELLPIVMACLVWGKLWKRQSVFTHCDNQSVVEIINSGYSRDPELMQLLCSLFFITAYFEIILRAVHIPGIHNIVADALSRDNLILFHCQVPGGLAIPVNDTTSGDRSADKPEARLDIPMLAAAVQELLELPQPTGRTLQETTATWLSAGAQR